MTVFMSKLCLDCAWVVLELVENILEVIPLLIDF